MYAGGCVLVVELEGLRGSIPVMKGLLLIHCIGWAGGGRDG